MAEGDKKPQFNPSSKAHVVDAKGAKFITYVGLQAKLVDQNKWIKSTDTEIIQFPWENPENILMLKTTMVIVDQDGNEATYRAFGDAVVENKEKGIKGNIGAMVAPHWYRMAETRGHVRALRQATRSEYAAREELGGD